MAIKEINGVITANYNISATLQTVPGNAVHAGSSVTVDAPTGLLRLADRSLAPLADQFYGFSADDASRTGNQFIQADPVGGNYLTQDSSGAYNTILAGNNAWYSSVKRAIGDFQDETVTNVTNLTAGASGYEGPHRGVGVYTTPSGQFILDASVIAPFYTTSAIADLTTVITPAPGDLMTFGAGPNKGKLVVLAKDSNGNANLAHGPAVARVDRYDGTTSLLYITQLAV